MAESQFSATPAIDDSVLHASPTFDLPQMRFREPLALLLWVILADWLIFRGGGFSGLAAFLVFTPCFFWLGRTKSLGSLTALGLVALTLVVAIRLVWQGSIGTLLAAAVVLLGLAMSAAGAKPRVLEGVLFTARLPFDGLVRLVGNHRSVRLDRRWSVAVATYLMPIAAAMLFGGIFVFANPDLLTSVSGWIRQFIDRLCFWLEEVSVAEIPFCLFALVMGAGLLHPKISKSWNGTSRVTASATLPTQPAAETGGTMLYPAFRNVLITLIGLFAVYLGFEFITLWQRDFPDGFYYAGYAHEGAAWLTLALALATVTLSLIFSGATLTDIRYPRLRSLAWIWSAQNLILAAAVYNRLMIYVGYNGMTRMRMVGFFGITLVVIGFTLVIVKIANRRNVSWLLGTQLLAMLMAVISYFLFPVDFLVHRYNVNQVCRGHLHPAVMIAMKEITDEGVFPLVHLMDHEDAIIRDGVLAILAERQERIVAWASKEDWHWTRYQASTDFLATSLLRHQASLASYRNDPVVREQAIQRFRQYAMQWY